MCIEIQTIKVTHLLILLSFQSIAFTWILYLSKKIKKLQSYHEEETTCIPTESGVRQGWFTQKELDRYNNPPWYSRWWK